jgi:hypothetical protein
MAFFFIADLAAGAVIKERKKWFCVRASLRDKVKGAWAVRPWMQLRGTY